MAEKTQRKQNQPSPQAKGRDERDPRRAADLRQRDLASDIQGRNKLQGDDQGRVRNQRREQPKVGGASGRTGPQKGRDEP